jgi:hypothetical protein
MKIKHEKKLKKKININKKILIRQPATRHWELRKCSAWLAGIKGII